MTDHSIGELAALSGLSVRTIRYYLAEGLIPSAGREGPAARYPETTLAKLRLIARLRDAHLPLAEIRRGLERLSDEQLLELAADAPRASTPDVLVADPADVAPGEPGSALDYVRGLLDRGTHDAGTLPALLSRTSPPLMAMSAADLLAPSLRAAPAPAPAPPTTATTTGSTPSPVRSQWERIVLTPEIELHLRRPLSRRDNRMVERLIAFARQLQGEDRP